MGVDLPFDLAAILADAAAEAATDSAGEPAVIPFDLQVSLPDSDVGPYTGFGLSVSIGWAPGLAWAPLAAGPRAKTVFWRTSAQTSTKTVAWAASRLVAKPVLPHVDTGTSNDVLVSVAYSKPTPADLPDGSRYFVSYGEYRYVQQTPIDPMAPIIVPNTALRVAAQVQYDPATFSRLLAGPVVPPAEYDGTRVDF